MMKMKLCFQLLINLSSRNLSCFSYVLNLATFFKSLSLLYLPPPFKISHKHNLEIVIHLI